MRFDAVYVGHFKCNLRRIVDYPNLSGYLRDLYQYPGIAATVDLDQIKRHYYRTHPHAQPDRASCRSALRSTSPRRTDASGSASARSTVARREWPPGRPDGAIAAS